MRNTLGREDSSVITWDALLLLVAIAVPVGLLLRLLSRPIDSRSVPRDGLATPAEGDVPGLAAARRSSGSGDSSSAG